MTDNIKFIEQCENALKESFKYIDDVSYFNQKKVLEAFQKHSIAVRHFAGTTGYGYGDEGRDTLGKLYADVFGAEDGIVSPHLLSGTHSLSVALFGLVNRGDTVLCISGTPYDTIRPVIFGDGIGSLKDYGVDFICCELTADGDFNATEINGLLNDSVKLIYIQRSRGYELRDALSCGQIGKICQHLRKIGFTGTIFVDNCYGEFVEKQEPTEVGADICVGSLIKNAGGGLAPTGGYIVGKSELIEKIGRRFTAPSIGLEVGSYALGYQYFYQGLFMASHTVAQALKCSLIIGKAMTELGYKNYPAVDKIPHDITRCIQFDSADKMIDFIR
ncbi:MAG: methionine gamma-lyase family protein, partial [Clostridia bacterium]|nr:methionine gamma-lyase family protein [Clostridia bacterium]